MGVALTGSVAGGEDRPGSDIDLVALAVGQPPRGGGLRAVDGRIVSVGWHTVDEVRESMRQPADVGAVVPGWRDATPLADPQGLVAELSATARDWTWEPIGFAADAYVADTVTGLAEEAGKVAGLAAIGRARAAAVNRALLVIQLGSPLAVHHRVLYGTENRLWDELARLEGPDWAAAVDVALGLAAPPAGFGSPTAPSSEGVSRTGSLTEPVSLTEPASLAAPVASPLHEAACRSALRVYALAAARVRRLLTPGQRAVIDTVLDPVTGTWPGRT